MNRELEQRQDVSYQWCAGENPSLLKEPTAQRKKKMLIHTENSLTVHAPYHVLMEFLIKAQPTREIQPTQSTPAPPTTLLPAMEQKLSS